MVTPKEYKINLENRIITRDMLRDSLWSVNKRAKNFRDKEQAYAQTRRNNRYFIDWHDNEDKYAELKEAYYQKKEKLLTLVTPDCIHVEQQTRRKRIYDYEPEYKELKNEDVIYANSYCDAKRDRRVYFVDIQVPYDKYYLFYDFGICSFHTPISSLKGYELLNKVNIGNLTTYGHDITDLISVQFVGNVLGLIDSGNYTYIG